MIKTKLELEKNIEYWKSEEIDLMQISKTELHKILFNSIFINLFENKLIRLQQKGQLWGPLHTSLGVEAIASAAIQMLEKKDRITATHRAHHHFLAKAINFLADDTWDPTQANDLGFLEDMVTKTMAEILGLKIGFCGGRGGSMHLYFPEAGIHGTNGIVGGGIPAANGLAFASKILKKNEVAIAFFGDGAINQGSFHESCNLAALWKLPTIFFIENNQYAVGTKVEDASAGSELATRGIAYGMPSYLVDGEDLVAVRAATEEAINNARNGLGPSLIEVKCYRQVHHDTELQGSAYGYRSEAEEKQWREKDPLKLLKTNLINHQIISQDQIAKIENQISLLLEVVENKLIENDQIKDSLWPEINTLAQGVRSNGDEFQSIDFSEPPVKYQEEGKLKYSQVIARTKKRWLEKDYSVVEWGEDIANFGSGPYGATEKLMVEFPDRVLNTPISENGFVGLSLGAAMNGLKPIVEIMFPDFSLVAADQLFNQIGKARHMYGGSLDLPIIVRTRVATGTGMGPQHSMDPTGMFNLFSGWRIIAPSNALDYIGLFNTAMISNDPVLIVEHNSLYNRRFSVPHKELWDYYIPFGKSKVLKTGTDITVVTYGGMTQKVEAAIEDIGNEVSVELIDLRTVDLMGLDYNSIADSVKKTGFLVFVEESIKSQGIGAQVCLEICSRAYSSLKAAPKLLTSADVPISVSKPLERAAILQKEDVSEFLLALKRGDK